MTWYNFPDGNTLVCFGKTIKELIGSLESACEVALNWFNEIKVILNLGKYLAVVIDKRKQEKEIFKTGSKKTKVASQVKRLEAEIDDKLHFEQLKNSIC